MNTSVALERELSKCGYRVSVALNGGDGMDLIWDSIKSGDRIDLVIVDIQIPEMSGSRLIVKLKTEGIGIPVFVLSGELDKKFLVNLLSVGGAVSFERAWPITCCEQQDEPV